MLFIGDQYKAQLENNELERETIAKQAREQLRETLTHEHEVALLQVRNSYEIELQLAAEKHKAAQSQAEQLEHSRRTLDEARAAAVRDADRLRDEMQVLAAEERAQRAAREDAERRVADEQKRAEELANSKLGLDASLLLERNNGTSACAR